MDNEQRMDKMGEVLKAIEAASIPVKYNHWSGEHTLEIALHNKHDYEKAHTLLKSSENTLGYVSVMCIDGRNMLLFIF